MIRSAFGYVSIFFGLGGFLVEIDHLMGYGHAKHGPVMGFGLACLFVATGLLLLRSAGAARAAQAPLVQAAPSQAAPSYEEAQFEWVPSATQRGWMLESGQPRRILDASAAPSRQPLAVTRRPRR